MVLESGASGADWHAGRILAMLTAGDHEEALDVGEAPLLDIEHAPPLHIGRGRIVMLAGDGTGLTADASVEVDDHAPAGRE